MPPQRRRRNAIHELSPEAAQIRQVKAEFMRREQEDFKAMDPNELREQRLLNQQHCSPDSVDMINSLDGLALDLGESKHDFVQESHSGQSKAISQNDERFLAEEKDVQGSSESQSKLSLHGMLSPRLDPDFESEVSDTPRFYK